MFFTERDTGQCTVKIQRENAERCCVQEMFRSPFSGGQTMSTSDVRNGMMLKSNQWSPPKADGPPPFIFLSFLPLWLIYCLPFSTGNPRAHPETCMQWNNLIMYWAHLSTECGASRLSTFVDEGDGQSDNCIPGFMPLVSGLAMHFSHSISHKKYHWSEAHGFHKTPQKHGTEYYWQSVCY